MDRNVFFSIERSADHSSSFAHISVTSSTLLSNLDDFFFYTSLKKKIKIPEAIEDVNNLLTIMTIATQIAKKYI
jgi:hypothetical protein